MADDEDTLGTVEAPELFRRVLDAQRRTLRTATPGVIQTYRRTGDQKNTADVEQPVRPDGEEQPVLSHVPVMVLGGGDGALIFPYDVGDSGLLIFCESEIGTWRASGDVGAPADEGRLTSAGPVLIPGLRPVADALDAAAGVTALVGSDVRLGTATGLVKAAVHEDLLSDLDALLGLLSTWGLAIDVAVTGIPGGSPNWLAVSGQLAAMQASIAAGSYQSPTVSVEE